MQYSIAASILALTVTVSATPATTFSNNVFAMEKRATFPVPASEGSVTYDAAESISGAFDGGMKTYGRGIDCSGQTEGGDADAVFILEDGATLSNAIIGKDQKEGVHCKGSCTIENVWWVDVCEDALSIKGDGDASIIGGGAANADDKVIQHNGEGSVTIDGFTVMDFGKLYRSCGNCKNSVKRTVSIKNVKAFNGKTLIGINPNFGDTGSITDTCATEVKTICEEFEGTTPGNEPVSVSKGPSDTCVFSTPEAC